MKALLLSVFIFMAGSIHARLARADGVPKEVVLVTIDLQNETLNSEFNFRTMSTPTEANDFDISYEGTFSDSFYVNSTNGGTGVLFDLGVRDCTSIKSNTPELKESKPLLWLANSDANPHAYRPQLVAPVLAGHCYTLVKLNERSALVSLFHVKSFVSKSLVVLDQIQVLQNVSF